MRRVVQGCIGIAEKSAEKATTRPETSCKGIELSGLAEKRNSAVPPRTAANRRGKDTTVLIRVAVALNGNAGRRYAKALRREDLCGFGIDTIRSAEAL